MKPRESDEVSRAHEAPRRAAAGRAGRHGGTGVRVGGAVRVGGSCGQPRSSAPRRPAPPPPPLPPTTEQYCRTLASVGALGPQLRRAPADGRWAWDGAPGGGFSRSGPFFPPTSPSRELRLGGVDPAPKWGALGAARAAGRRRGAPGAAETTAAFVRARPRTHLPGARPRAAARLVRLVALLGLHHCPATPP